MWSLRKFSEAEGYAWIDGVFLYCQLGKCTFCLWQSSTRQVCEQWYLWKMSLLQKCF